MSVGERKIEGTKMMRGVVSKKNAGKARQTNEKTGRGGSSLAYRSYSFHLHTASRPRCQEICQASESVRCQGRRAER